MPDMTSYGDKGVLDRDDRNTVRLTPEIIDQIIQSDIHAGDWGLTESDMASYFDAVVDDAVSRAENNHQKAQAIIVAAGKLTFGGAGEFLAEKLAGIMAPQSIEAVKQMLALGIDSLEIANNLNTMDFIDSGDSAGAGDMGQTGTSGGTGGTTGTDSATSDPTSYDFWDSFVDEWIGKNTKSAKDMFLEDDIFRKEQVAPAIGTYRDLLSDLTTQAQTGTGVYSPVKFGMGNFRTSFVPKSNLITAEHLKGYGKEDLASSLALTDVLQPNRGAREYLTALQNIAQWKYEKDLAEKGIDVQHAIGTHEPDDKGTWLDAIKDIVQIGDTVGDTIKKYWP
jgi:hypothetical protein